MYIQDKHIFHKLGHILNIRQDNIHSHKLLVQQFQASFHMLVMLHKQAVIKLYLSLRQNNLLIRLEETIAYQLTLFVESLDNMHYCP
jgi:hypothetical protein